MHKLTKNEKIIYILVQAGIALFLFYFFAKICPLVVFDCDDWKYLGTFRLPIPIWKGWNPARVMPESLMPVAGWIAAHIIYPICGDYVYSVIIISAIIITLLITMMCICLQKLLVKRCCLTVKTAAVFEILFLTLFFLIFRNRGTSQCMFTAADLCCVYFYTMSGILNAIVVLILMQSDNMTEMFLSWKWIQKLLFLIVLYFALFSNLFHSAITAIYAGVYLLINLRYMKQDFKLFVWRNIISLLILITWGVALLYEANGGRADAIGMGMTLDFALSIRQLIAMIFAFSKPFVIVCILIFIVVIKKLIRDMHKYPQLENLLLSIVCSGILLMIFLILLNAKFAYMARMDASWGLWFYLITIVVVAGAYLVKDSSLMTKLLPVAVPLFIFAAAYPDGKFLMSTRAHTDYEICMQLNQYVVNSIMAASEKGEAEITIRIPNHSDDLRSLTYNEGLGNTVAECLYNQGIISKRFNVQTIVDENMTDNDIKNIVEKANWNL